MGARTIARRGALLGWAAIAIGGTIPADAQTATQTIQPTRHPRITVVPLSRYHRQCDFWLATEHRPSGDVITPQQHCWWTR